jgi:hypothetical protein
MTITVGSIYLDKDKWVSADRLRLAGLLSVPTTESLPKGFPSSTLSVQRALCAVASLSPDDFVPCIDALYHAIWVDGDGFIGQPENFMPILEKTLKGTTATAVLNTVSDICLHAM